MLKKNPSKVPAWKIIGYSIVALIILQQTACSITSVVDRTDHSVVFFPPLPNKPRIQFLTNINAARIQNKDRSAFSDFILGEDESADSRINKPYGVAYYNNQVFVVDTRAPGYFILSVDDKLIKAVSGSGGGRMRKPINITIDRQGNRYITDTERDQILVFDESDSFVQAFGVKDQFKPGDVLIKNDTMYVTDLKHHVVHVMDKNSGETRGTIGKKGSKKGELFFPTNLAMDPLGNIVVSDTGNYRLQIFTPEGDFVKSIGQAGNGLGQFARPKGVAIDKEGRIYAVDSSFENVQLFNKEGQVLLFFGGAGNEPDNVNLPADVTIRYGGMEKFQKFADPDFTLEYVIFVSSQFGRNKIAVFGFGEYHNTSGKMISSN